MRWVGVTAVVATLAGSVFAAEPKPEAADKFALAWVRDDGAESCPAGRDFADEVTRRLGRSPFDARAARSIEIHVERDATEFRSRVFVREHDGVVTGRRALVSPDCAALFSATALAVALVIDPDAMARADTNRAQSVAHFELPGPPPRIATPTPTTSPAPPRPPPDRAPASPPPASGAAARASASATGNAAFVLGVLPEARPGVELKVLARAGARWQVAAAALYASPGTETTSEASFGVGLTAFSVSALLGLVESPAFGLTAEAGAWAGALHVAVRPASTGSPVSPTHPGDFPWLALSAGLYARAPLARRWFFEAGALGLASLLRRELELTLNGGTTMPVWTQPVIGGLFTAGFGANFF